MEIELEEFKRLRKGLRYLSDLSQFNYPRGMLFTILSQKKVDQVKRDYGKVCSRLEDISKFWESRKRIPNWMRLTPMMRVRLLLKALEYTKREIRDALNDPEKIDDESLRKLIWKSVFTDYIYSPLAVKHQFARGRLGELIIQKWLDERGIDYKTEKDLRRESIKTPDFYFSDPIRINDFEINWIESKALFGDPRTHWIYWKKQFSKYLELFGQGFVVYWFGKISELDKNVKVWEEEFFKSKLMQNLLDMKIYTLGIKGRSEEEIEKILKKFSITSVFEVDVESGVEATPLEFENSFSREFIQAASKVIDAYSEGRVIILGAEKDWRKCKRKYLSFTLRNMGFWVYHLR
ncbi:MAG: TPD domain-containing protein [Archaeoglobus sp.]|nr:TPD domain-containing protein [Archaeoglobus sp.]